MIDDDVKALAQAPNFATLTTLGRDGSPSTHVMWVHADDDYIRINTEVHRQKYRNVSRDPRVTVTIIDRDNPYRYAEVRGRVVDTVKGDEARADIDALSEKYLGQPYGSPIQSERVVLLVEPFRQRVNG